jgi:hypothetical protein
MAADVDSALHAEDRPHTLSVAEYPPHHLSLREYTVGLRDSLLECRYRSIVSGLTAGGTLAGSSGLNRAS